MIKENNEDMVKKAFIDFKKSFYQEPSDDKIYNYLNLLDNKFRCYSNSIKFKESFVKDFYRFTLNKMSVLDIVYYLFLYTIVCYYDTNYNYYSTKDPAKFLSEKIKKFFAYKRNNNIENIHKEDIHIFLKIFSINYGWDLPIQFIADIDHLIHNRMTSSLYFTCTSDTVYIDIDNNEEGI